MSLDDARVVDAFLAANWLTIAASAWRGFQELGKGALLLREYERLSRGRTTYQKGELEYLTRAQLIDEELPDAVRYVDAYNPHDEAVVIIVRDDGPDVYQVRKAPGPAQAFAMEEAQGN